MYVYERNDMQGNNPVGKSQGGQKQSGLSWSQPSTQQSGTVNAAALSDSKNSDKSFTSTTTPVRPASMNTAGNTPRMAGTFIGGMVVGGLLAWALMSIQADPSGIGGSATTTPRTGEATTGGVNTGLNQSGMQLSVQTQNAGREVSVAGVSVTKPTWVVVYDSTNGQPGKALGAKMFFPENNGKAATIRLQRSTIAGQSYLIGGRVDNGDRTFNGATDTALLNTAGNRILIPFRVQ